MSLPKLFPDIYVPTFELKVGGVPLDPENSKRVIQISVSEHLDPPHQFSMQFYDPGLKLIDASSGKLAEGKRVEIMMGYLGTRKNVQKLMVGTISAVAADFTSGPQTAHLDGFALSHKLMRGKCFRRFDESTSDGQIVSQVVQDIPDLEVSVDSTPDRTLAELQNNESDFEFLERLAKRNGYSLWADGTTLYFKKQRTSPNSVKLEWGKTLLSFSPRLSIAGQVNKVEVRGWDPLQKQPISSVATSGASSGIELSPSGAQQVSKGSGGQSQETVLDSGATSADQAQRIADSRVSSLAQTLVGGSGTSVGNPDIHAGTVLEISGTWRFDGKYNVTEATHTISSSGYQTSFQFSSGSAPLGPMASSGVGSQRGGAGNRIYGVTTGIVTANKDDGKDHEQGIGRVKVRFPGLNDDQVGTWARLGVLMAGPQRGTFFLPEKDDEVLVAFENGDANRPYVLAALWNGKDAPPDTNSDGKNNIRFIKSRSGHVIRLDDTDGSEKIEIIDKTGGNSITIDSAKNLITLKSAKDVSIEAAKGKITLKAQNVEVSSTADTKVQADTGLTLTASEGNTTIKGTAVNIN